MKKYIKWAIFGVLIIILIIICMIIFMNKNNNIKETAKIGETKKISNTFTAIQDSKDYFIVKNIIDRYFMNIKELNGDSYINEDYLKISKEQTIEQKEKEAIKFLNDVLDEQYKKQFNINDETITNEAKRYSQNGNYNDPNVIYNINLNSLYKCDYEDDISIFLILAHLKEKNINMLIKFDNKNNLYSIFLADYIEDNNIDINSDNIKISNDSIEENIHNKVIIGTITDEEVSKEYFNIQKNNLLYDLKEEYKKVNEEYKNKKFQEYSDFVNYFSNKITELINSKLDKYSIESINNKKIYTLIDNYNNCYILEVTNEFIEYDVKFDNYTVDSEKFKNKYNQANDQEKVVLNMGKVITAINNQDYRYVYSKLADSFKSNYFDSEDSLKEFLQRNIYRKNQIEFDDFEREGNVYTYKVRIVKQYEDGEEIPEGKNAPYRKFNIVMQLKEGTDFVMSFSIDE